MRFSRLASGRGVRAAQMLPAALAWLVLTGAAASAPTQSPAPEAPPAPPAETATAAPAAAPAPAAPQAAAEPAAAKPTPAAPTPAAAPAPAAEPTSAAASMPAPEPASAAAPAPGAESAPAAAPAPDAEPAATAPEAPAPAAEAPPAQPAAAEPAAAESAAAQPAAGDAAAPAPATPETAAPAAPAAPHHHVVTLGPEGQDEQGQVGRVHTVVKGDTLWAITQAYLGTPWTWPTVWDANTKVVENPHWIYPGEKIWVSAGGMRPLTDDEASKMLQRQATAPAPQPPAAPAPPPPTARMLNLPALDSAGFISNEAWNGASSIVGSPVERTYLSQPDPVVIGLGEGVVHVGDQFTIFDREEPIYDPESHHLLGHLVNVLGWIEITQVDKDTSRGVIRTSYGEFRRDARVVPRKAPPSSVALSSTPENVDGVIAALPASRSQMGSPDVVYLNRGSAQGLAVGSLLDVVRPYGTLHEYVQGTNVHPPDEVVASLVVVSTEPDTATAVVTRTTTELMLGDLFRGASLK